jgi:hypothetical protein
VKKNATHFTDESFIIGGIREMRGVFIFDLLTGIVTFYRLSAFE